MHELEVMFLYRQYAKMFRCRDTRATKFGKPQTRWYRLKISTQRLMFENVEGNKTVEAIFFVNIFLVDMSLLSFMNCIHAVT